MKLNNKGFAITGFLYSIFAIFLVILSLLIITLVNSKLTMQKLKNRVKEDLSEVDIASIDKFAEIVIDENVVNLQVGDSYNLLDGVTVKRYDGKILTSTISYESKPEFTTTIAGTYIITYKTIMDNATYTNTKTITVGFES